MNNIFSLFKIIFIRTIGNCLNYNNTIYLIV